jgi:predicted NACHT family NTPase
VLLYTFDELIEEDINFVRYFAWLDAQVQAADIDRLYVPLAVTVNEVDASGILESDSTYENISDYVDRWMEDSDGEHLSLLGEFGTGKSWFAFKYAHDMVAKYREAQEDGLKRPRVPLLIRLREYARGFKDVGALLTDVVFREHRVNIPSLAVLETLNRMGRLLFIFDGFDEMAARVDQQKMVDNFWSLASVLGPGSKAILTCRTEYFQFAKQAREV